MKLADLKAKGACIDPAPVRKSITWKHTDESGEEITDTFDVWVTRLSFGVIDRLSKINSADRSSNAELIAASVRLGENAEEPLTYEIAYSLNSTLALELVRAVAAVNRLSETEDSGSSPKD
jgi:hypothetical protein